MHGNEEARATLLGEARTARISTVLLDERFERRGAYYVPNGSVDWDSLGPSYRPREDGRPIPTRGIRRTRSSCRCETTGETCSASSPSTSRSAAAPERRRARSARRARRSRGPRRRGGARSADARRHQRALEELLDVSSRITGETSTDEILRRVCGGIRDALDFDNVCAALVDPDTGALVPKAVAGWRLEEMRRRVPVTVAQIEPLLDASSNARAASSSRTPRRTRDSARRRRLPVAAQRARPVGVEPALAARAAPRRRGRAARDHLGGQPARPARPVRRPSPGSADLRERRGRRARLGQASRRAALSRRSRSADAPSQPPRVRLAPRRRGRARDAVRPDRRPRRRRPRPLQAPQRPLRPRPGDEALVVFSGVLTERCAGPTPRSASAATSSRCSSPRRPRTTRARRRAHPRDARDLAAGGNPWAASLTASFGFALCPPDASDAQTLFRLADEALYEAKRTARPARRRRA